MFQALGRWGAAYPKTIICFWLVVLAAAAPFGMKLQDALKGGDLSIPTSESSIAKQYIQSAFDGVSTSRLILVVENAGVSTESPAFRAFTAKLKLLLKKEAGVTKIADPYALADSRSIDAANRRLFIYADLEMDEQRSRLSIQRLRESIAAIVTDGFDVKLTGSPALSAEGSDIAKQNVKTVEKIGLPFVFLLLLLVFRTLPAALLPLLTGISAILISMAVAYGFALHLSLSSLLTNIITMLGLGIAIDYALFMTQRFREELASGREVREAVIAATEKAGRSVFFAGATVAVSTGSILLSNTAFARSIALGGTLVVIAAVLISVTLLPAVLMLLGHRINALAVPWVNKNEQSSRAWAHTAGSIMKRPVLYLAVALLPLLALIAPLFQINLHLPSASFEEMPPSSEARQGMEALTGYLGDGASFPIRILLQSDTPVLESSALRQIDRLADRLRALPHVQAVQSLRSVVTPAREHIELADWQAKASNGSLQADPDWTRLAPFVSRDAKAALLWVIPDTSPSAAETRELVSLIRDDVLSELPTGLNGSLTGETASGLDYDAAVLHAFPMIIVLVLVLTFVLLYAAFRSVLIPLKAILMNLLVTASALGFIVLMYQFGYMAGASPLPLNINTPLALFVLLFGLSMDYEVILIARMKERYHEVGDHEASIAEGIASTAGVINGAASIMVIVFGVFVFADLQLIEELGVGLAFAILIDAFIVRTVLVPVFMRLLGESNWRSFSEWLAMLSNKGAVRRKRQK